MIYNMKLLDSGETELEVGITAQKLLEINGRTVGFGVHCFYSKSPDVFFFSRAMMIL